MRVESQDIRKRSGGEGFIGRASRGPLSEVESDPKPAKRHRRDEEK